MSSAFWYAIGIKIWINRKLTIFYALSDLVCWGNDGCDCLCVVKSNCCAWSAILLVVAICSSLTSNCCLSSSIKADCSLVWACKKLLTVKPYQEIFVIDIRDCLKTKNSGIIWGKTNRGFPMTTPKRYELEDAQWDRIKGYFPPYRTGRPSSLDNRTALNSILWLMRSGAPWRDSTWTLWLLENGV